MSKALPVLVAGGGIGGLAAALALVRRGLQVKVLEQSPEIGEIESSISSMHPCSTRAVSRLGPASTTIGA